MTESVSLIEDLYRYNDWANARVFAMCLDLTQAQLDETREIGFGSLRNTLFHILTAEQIWLERWQVVSWRPFPTDSMGMGLDDIEAQFKQIAQARQQMIGSERATKWKRVVNYKDSRGTEFSNPLDLLLLHVVNHSIYHRAQALNLLKSLGRTVPIGLDYIFYKLARPTLEQDSASLASCRSVGLEIASGLGRIALWNHELVERYYAYHDWGTDQVLDIAAGASDDQLDRDFDIGPGSIRKTLMHALQVEEFWWSSLQEPPTKPCESPPSGVGEMRDRWNDLRLQRNAFIASLDGTTAQRVISVAPAGEPLKVRVLEALVQVAGHGTHHRAQLVNMLRHSQLAVPSVDVVDWYRQ